MLILYFGWEQWACNSKHPIFRLYARPGTKGFSSIQTIVASNWSEISNGEFTEDITCPLEQSISSLNVKVIDWPGKLLFINPFCEIAVEEAIRLKERGIVTEIVAVSVGLSQSQEQIRTALALGADRGILIQTESDIEPLAIAKCLKKICENESPDIVLLGKQAIDGDNNQTGQMLAALMGIGQATFASEIIFDEKDFKVTREVDGGLQTLGCLLYTSPSPRD